MWSSELPDEADELRQGDLLHDLLLPKLQLPFNFLRAAGRSTPQAGDPIQVSSLGRDYLVVTPCCTIANTKFVALAPVRSTPPLKPDEFAAYEAEEPSGGDESEFAYGSFHLAPLAGIVEHPPNRLRVADLPNVQSFEGDRTDFRRARVAAMSPEGRRLLRLKLSYFWGRVEAEDLAWFEENGLPAGPAVE